jgi:hypothetical protein
MQPDAVSSRILDITTNGLEKRLAGDFTGAGLCIRQELSPIVNGRPRLRGRASGQRTKEQRGNWTPHRLPSS